MSWHMLKRESPSPTARDQRLVAPLTQSRTHQQVNPLPARLVLYNGGALDSQVTDSQYIDKLTKRSAPLSDESFNSSDSSDTVYDKEEVYGLSVDDPMESDDCPPYDTFKKHYAELRAPRSKLSASEAQIIAVIWADRDAEAQRWERDEMYFSAELHEQSVHMAALETLLEYHRLPIPPR
ncbi:hypothetical protein FB45DRAFT_878290 [Roridomyces roridus]|uniref:Uncharacterized protein n=1 Tax=Roridomyces roridus TaxID=1738132 RepID=A0AAD7B0S3_9AGAR|nr:hypothetical protein FB45DRAFT_878290 [Roridomyces roridus]